MSRIESLGCFSIRFYPRCFIFNIAVAASTNTSARYLALLVVIVTTTTTTTPPPPPPAAAAARTATSSAITTASATTTTTSTATHIIMYTLLALPSTATNTAATIASTVHSWRSWQRSADGPKRCRKLEKEDICGTRHEKT